MDHIKTNFIEHLFLVVKNQNFSYKKSAETINSKTNFFIFNLFLAVYSLLNLFLRISNNFFETFINKHKQYRTSNLKALRLEFIFLENRFFINALDLRPIKLKVYEKVSY